MTMGTVKIYLNIKNALLLLTQLYNKSPVLARVDIDFLSKHVVSSLGIARTIKPFLEQ